MMKLAGVSVQARAAMMVEHTKVTGGNGGGWKVMEMWCGGGGRDGWCRRRVDNNDCKSQPS